MKVRIISGIVGAVPVILVLALHKTFFFPLAVAALICLALFELYRAGKCLHCRISMAAGFVYAIVMPFLNYYGNQAALVGVTFLCLMAMFAELVLFHEKVDAQEILYMAAVTLLVSGSLNALILLLQSSAYGLGYVILALSSAWVSDTGAYFVGTFIGRHKLCPKISPKKTVEGFFGGILTDIVVMILIALVYSLIAKAHVEYAWLIFTAIVCAVVGVLGDLSASVFKRQQGLKDFGNIMPGHGGMMDRFDSVLFAVPAFYALICMSPIFEVKI